jgi:hypothetical protein
MKINRNIVSYVEQHFTHTVHSIKTLRNGRMCKYIMCYNVSFYYIYFCLCKRGISDMLLFTL